MRTRSLLLSLIAVSIVALPLLVSTAPATTRDPGDKGLSAPVAAHGKRPAANRNVTVYRDEWGVPHVHGITDADAAFGSGYAQAEDNFRQIEDNFIRSVGRAAEVYGEAHLLDDWVNRSLRVVELSHAEYERAEPRVRALLEGFAAGIDHYVTTHPEVRPLLLERFEPWYPLAMIRYLYYQNGFLGAARLRRSEIEAAFARIQRTRDTGSRAGADPIYAEAPEGRGSNSWAVMPERSATGNALLFINPHLPFFGPSQTTEGHVISDEGWNFTGYGRFGFVFPYVGTNPNLGWASTDNAADLTDVYVEDFDGDARRYRYDDGWRDATVRTATVIVAGDPPQTRRVSLLSTHHGAVLGLRDGKLLAVRMAKYEEDGWFAQWYSMTRAASLAEFRVAVERLDMLFGNYLYADRDGNILYVYNGAVPIREAGPDWSGPVDGSDPATEWRGYHPMAEIPQVFNPVAGWVQNCNSTPFTSTSDGNPDPTAFPEYMVREADTARARGARRILGGRDLFTWEEWQRLAFDTYVVHAEEHLPGMLDAVAGGHSALAGPIDELRRWDRIATVESVATTLYVLWWERLGGLRRAADGDIGPEAGTLESDALATIALEHVVSTLNEDRGTWRVAWGDINRLQRIASSGEQRFDDAGQSLPLRGMPSWAGTMFTYWSAREPGRMKRYARGGNSYVSVVDFADPPHVLSLHTFGQSVDPMSPHHLDQAPLYAAGRFKPAWLELRDVRGNAASAVSLR